MMLAFAATCRHRPRRRCQFDQSYHGDRDIGIPRLADRFPKSAVDGHVRHDALGFAGFGLLAVGVTTIGSSLRLSVASLVTCCATISACLASAAVCTLYTGANYVITLSQGAGPVTGSLTVSNCFQSAPGTA